MKSKRIKNDMYNEFLETGNITTINQDDIEGYIKNIKHKNFKQAKALLICLYFTGCRPIEALELKCRDITKEARYIVIKTYGAKNGLTRPIRIPYKYKLVKDFYAYISTLHPDMYLFFDFRSTYTRTRINKKGEVIKYKQTTNNLAYWFKKWTNNKIIPYFLRHNRFSKLAMCGAQPEEIRILKGAKSYNSVIPYVHMSKFFSEKIARKIE